MSEELTQDLIERMLAAPVSFAGMPRAEYDEKIRTGRVVEFCCSECRQALGEAPEGDPDLSGLHFCSVRCSKAHRKRGGPR